MILFQPIQQRLCNFDEPIFVDENLLGRQALMGGSIGIEDIECSTATIEDAPDIALLEIALLG